jgi:Na+/melibiose symporter-like transporter
MLFFFTLGASMVGDICDEDELNTGYRAEGSYYSVFWWFIKMGTALASLISGALIVLTMFDEAQVTKVDKLQGDVRDLRASVVAFQRGDGEQAPLQAKLDLAKSHSAELFTYLQGKATTAGRSRNHYESLAHTTHAINATLSRLRAGPRLDSLDAELATVETTLVQLTKQPPRTLLMMRVVEISVPLIACLFSLLFVLRYALTETRSREIKNLLDRRHAAREAGADPAAV